MRNEAKAVSATTPPSEDLRIEGEVKEGVIQFEGDILALKKRSDKLAEDHRLKFGFAGQDFQIRTPSGMALNCHRSEFGTLYFRDKHGSLRKATEELKEKLVNELENMAGQILPRIDTSFGQDGLLPLSVPVTRRLSGSRAIPSTPSLGLDLSRKEK